MQFIRAQKVQVLAEQPLTTIEFWPAVSVTGSEGRIQHWGFNPTKSIKLTLLYVSKVLKLHMIKLRNMPISLLCVLLESAHLLLLKLLREHSRLQGTYKTT